MCSHTSLGLLAIVLVVHSQGQTPSIRSDCIVSGWSAWSICSNGTSFRGRIVISHPLGGGQSCPSLRENRICGSVNNQLLANGTRQSPIDLADSRRSGTLVFDEALRHEPLTFIYNPKDMKSLQNVGSTFKMGVTDNAISTFQAGHIKRPYSLLEMHGHWGSSRTNGSEHTVNGQGYAAEIHFVHWNTEYGNVTNALKHKDGLAVVGVFLEEQVIGHKSLDSLVSLLKKITHKGDEIKLPYGYDLTKLIPSNRDFWTYDGSLTTPPFTECVIWTVMKTPLAISAKQLEAMRGLSSVAAIEAVEHRKFNIVNNVRPVQSQAERIVKTSFLKRK